MTSTVGRTLRVTCGRLSFAGLLVLGCGNLLGVHDPVLRKPDADGGAAGEKDSGTPHAGGNVGGESGDADSGAAGDAGRGATSNGGASGGEAGSTGGDGPLGGGGATAGGGGATGGVGVATGDTGGDTGGSGPAPACAASDPLRCDPASLKTPQVCSSGGQWVRNSAQNSGMDCPVACNDGVCGECSNGDVSCKDNYPRTCVSGTWVKPAFSCPDACVKGACVSAASCAGVVSPGSCNQESCCLSLEVTGNTFYRDTKMVFPATVSSFTMDKYEVTVARLKRYLTWYFGPEGNAPSPGAGKSPHSDQDPGWSANYPLPARTTQGMQDMQDMLSCVKTPGGPADSNATYLSANPLLPVNCVTFYVAYALCIWDGGRLPTEAEWSFAAASTEQRTYPWSNPPASTLINATYAVYGSNPIQAVGSLPNGAGPFGQMDLAGNVNEWTLDYFATPYPATCIDCINLTNSGIRTLRGGAFSALPQALRTSFRGQLPPETNDVIAGFRCVHDL